MRNVVAMPRSATISNVTVDELRIAGLPVTVTTAPNNTISLPGDKNVIYEQVLTLGGPKVNSIHITLPGGTGESSATSVVHKLLTPISAPLHAVGLPAHYTSDG